MQIHTLNLRHVAAFRVILWKIELLHFDQVYQFRVAAKIETFELN